MVIGCAAHRDQLDAASAAQAHFQFIDIMSGVEFEEINLSGNTSADAGLTQGDG